MSPVVLLPAVDDFVLIGEVVLLHVSIYNMAWRLLIQKQESGCDAKHLLFVPPLISQLSLQGGEINVSSLLLVILKNTGAPPGTAFLEVTSGHQFMFLNGGKLALLITSLN